MSFAVQSVGFFASLISLILWWPQAAVVWRSRNNPGGLIGVCISTQVLLLINASFWGAYAILTGSFWVGAPGLINAPLAILTIWIIMRARKQTTEVANIIEEHILCPSCGH